MKYSWKSEGLDNQIYYRYLALIVINLIGIMVKLTDIDL